MARILISNIDNPDMLSDRSALTYEFRCHSAAAASKHTWFAEPGDIVVLPELLSPRMQEYICKVKGIQTDSFTIIAPSHGPTEVRPIDADVLMDQGLLQQLKAVTAGTRNWELRPYHHDRAVCHVARQLKMLDGIEVPPFFAEHGADILNDKKVFRSLAAGRGIPIAEGTTAQTQAELLSALESLIGVTGAVIVKQNRHSGCLGNILVSAVADVDGQGAADILMLSDLSQMAVAARETWERLCGRSSGLLVVEAYYPVTKICYAEFLVREKGCAPEFLNLGEQRMEPLFAGFQIPGRIPPCQQAHLVTGATELVRLAGEFGFKGLIDVDAIVTRNGRVLFNEINGRYGGSSHIHYLAERILGAGYGNTHTILTRNGSNAPPIDEVIALIEGEGLDLVRGRSQGIVITAEDTIRTGKLDYMVAAPEQARAYEIEDWFLKQLKLMCGVLRRPVLRSASYH